MSGLGVVVALACICVATLFRALSAQRAHQTFRARRDEQREVDGARVLESIRRFTLSWREMSVRFVSRRVGAVIVAVGVLMLMRWYGFTVAIGLTAIVAVGVVVVRRCIQARQRQQIESDLVGWIEQIAYRQRAGVTLAAAVIESVHHAAPSLRPSLERLVLEVRHGVGLQDAIEHWAADLRSGQAHTFATALRIALRTGGEVADSCLRLAESLRKRHRLQDEVHALTGQMRASAYILIALPAVFGISSSMFDASARTFLFHTNGGLAVLLVGIAFEFIGALWMRKIAKVIL